ncbi:MAG: hypothetical protein DMF77_09480, partial [Acidobacteria bacterium]
MCPGVHGDGRPGRTAAEELQEARRRGPGGARAGLVGVRLWRWIIPLAVVASASLLPVPTGLTPHSMRYFALFAGVIAALIVEPLPAAAVGFVGMAVAAATRLVVPDAEGSLRW